MTGNDDRVNIYIISEGSIEQIHTSPLGGYSNVTISGNILTCTGTNTQLYTNFILVQLD